MLKFIFFYFNFVVFVCSAERFLALSGVVPEECVPSKAKLLSHSKMLFNARLNGHYGTKEMAEEVGMAHLRHATFENYGVGDAHTYVRKMENNSAYPLDPVAALIQWLYPSSGRVNLSHSLSSHDIFGVFTKRYMSTEPVVRNEAIEKLGRFYGEIVRAYQSIKSAPRGEVNISEFRTHYKDHFMRFLGDEFSTWGDIYNTTDVFASEISTESFEKVTEIIIESILSMRSNQLVKRLYGDDFLPALLFSFVTKVISSQTDMAKFYVAANLVAETTIFDADGKIKAKYLQDIATPDEYKAAINLVWHKRSTWDDYYRFYALDTYRTALPELSSDARSTFEIDGTVYSFSNCGENALRNFFIAILWDNNVVDTARLDHLEHFPHLQEMKRYFQKYNNIEQLNKPEAHNEWGDFVSNKNHDALPHMMKVHYVKNGIAELTGGMISTLNLMDILFFDAEAGQSALDFSHIWESSGLSTPNDQMVATKKWASIFNILTSGLLETPQPEITFLDEDGRSGENANIAKYGSIRFHRQDVELEYSFVEGHFLMQYKTSRYGSHERRMAPAHPILNAYNNKTIFRNYDFDQLIFFKVLNEKNDYFSHTILIRSLITQFFNRFDDEYTAAKIFYTLVDFFRLYDGHQLLNQVIKHPLGEFFLVDYFFPFAGQFKNPLMDALAHHIIKSKRVNSYVANLIEGIHPNPWPTIVQQFAQVPKVREKMIDYANMHYHADKVRNRNKHAAALKKAQAARKGLVLPIDSEEHALISLLKQGDVELFQSLTDKGADESWKDTSQHRNIAIILDEIEHEDIINLVVGDDFLERSQKIAAEMLGQPLPYSMALTFFLEAQRPDLLYKKIFEIDINEFHSPEDLPEEFQGIKDDFEICCNSNSESFRKFYRLGLLSTKKEDVARICQLRIVPYPFEAYNISVEMGRVLKEIFSEDFSEMFIPHLFPPYGSAVENFSSWIVSIQNYIHLTYEMTLQQFEGKILPAQKMMKAYSNRKKAAAKIKKFWRTQSTKTATAAHA